MRILGIDLGDARVGFAVSDELGYSAQPLRVLKKIDEAQLLATIDEIIGAEGITEIVVGLPLNMNGSAGPRALAARAFIEILKTRVAVPVHEWDERLSTAFAERLLIEGDMRRNKRKQVVDKIAAAVILQGFLDSRSRSF